MLSPGPSSMQEVHVAIFDNGEAKKGMVSGGRMREGRIYVVNVEPIDDKPMWNLKVNDKALGMVVFGVPKSDRPFSKSKVFQVTRAAMKSKSLELASPEKADDEEDEAEALMRDELGLPADKADESATKWRKKPW